jgi:CYTH domain-containing protein
MARGGAAMAREIERKFLVRGEGWRQGEGVPYRQGYLSREPSRTVRVRVARDKGYLTIKGASEGISRSEYEYPIPLADATELLDRLCERPLVEKTRYRIAHGAHTWEVDEFHGDNQGLVLAEVELARADERPALPDWIGEEVSDDPRYFNSNLVQRPYRSW